MTSASSDFQLKNGSQIGVIGGGPAGAMFSYFLLQLADLIDLDLDVDIYEPKDFRNAGPKGCNGCAGIISESLVQSLAVEGLALPTDVVQRGIESYVVHTKENIVGIETPVGEKRIAAVHRGTGPLGEAVDGLKSFDGFLLDNAIRAGASHLPLPVIRVSETTHRPVVSTAEGDLEYDMVAVCLGVNSQLMKDIAGDLPGFKPATSTKTHIREYYLGRDLIRELLGDSMHVFLLNIPRIEFAALVPKGEHATLCVLGDDIDEDVIDELLATPQVKELIPEHMEPKGSCRCSPSINVGAAPQPFRDRMVFIGDCGASRLYKDGIGAAYRTSKAAASTALFHGVSKDHFTKGFAKACNRLESDNRVGRLVFAVNGILQRFRLTRKGIMTMVRKEQHETNSNQYMSPVLWDTFTGSGSYKSILRRTVRPRFLWSLARSTMAPGRHSSSSSHRSH